MIATPVGLTVTPVTGGLSLAWGVSTTEGLGGWLVHWRTKAPPFVPWATQQLGASARTFLIPSLPVTPYEIVVRALIAGGVEISSGVPLPSNVVPLPIPFQP